MSKIGEARLGTESSLTSISAHFNTPASKRDELWKTELFARLGTSIFFEADCQEDPRLYDHPQVSAFTIQTPQAPSLRRAAFRYLCIQATEYGCGIAIDPHTPERSFGLSFGGLWYFREQHSFADYLSSLQRHRELVETGPRISLDSLPDPFRPSRPSTAEVPIYARRALKQYITGRLGIRNPGFCMVSDHTFQPALRCLVFGIYAHHFPNIEAYERAMQGMAWFLPPGLYVGIHLEARDYLNQFISLN